REVAKHGLPHHDSLTLWTLGAQWIDQQWLGQLFYYGLARLGGIRTVLFVHALVLVSTMAFGLRAARGLGASVPSVALAGVAALARALRGGGRVSLRLAVRLLARGVLPPPARRSDPPLLHQRVGAEYTVSEDRRFLCARGRHDLVDRSPRRAGHGLRAVGAA